MKRGLLTQTPNVWLHATPVNPAAENWTVRMFEAPGGPIEPKTGQPWKPYFGMVHVSNVGGVAEITGANTLPIHALGAMRDLGRKMGVKVIWWETWDHVHQIVLPPVVLRL